MAVPTPPNMMKIVKICPEGESSLTSLNPTVKIVITVIYRQSKNDHPSMMWKPETPISIRMRIRKKGFHIVD